ncbi:beta-galactoside alpha-2,6-sialyltransferase 1 [Ischnura elegans]|uniref:beta-galactoside alpha-2,6-sialyltransferase 1 n=1 Tax=Ischnura elegans TaxID=197161 RepID=UPI001ED8B403|nr:beta-galactoside alpha-2,6-sialyltransferase 1 [Ischnura elegans]XP_046393062.1 beta-galactoside alpha-2,6-sialyltransferase 1 [Ischnura elegans]
MTKKVAMRAVAVSVWIFINLVFVGMCGYIYLLWSQYWQYVARHQLGTPASAPESLQSAYSQFRSDSSNERVIAAASGLPVVSSSNRGKATERSSQVKRRGSNKSASSVVVKNSQPRFPKSRNDLEEESDIEVESRMSINISESKCGGGRECSVGQEEPERVVIKKKKPGASKTPLPLPQDKLEASIAAYKSQMVVQLRRVLLEESSVFARDKNVYNVQYSGPRGAYTGRAQDLVCELKRSVSIRMISPMDDPFRSLGLGGYLHKDTLFANTHFNTCAIVTNAGSLFGSELGGLIDSHDAVLRFNHAPTVGYESDVGSKTTLRIVNSQVVSKARFNFLHSPLYKNISLLAWDPSNYSSTLEEWYNHPDFDLFTPYFEHRALHQDQPSYLLDPRSQWSLWDFVQAHIPVRIRRNPPSSGFLGLAIMLPHCSLVDLFEYVPSMRLTKRCHYFDVAEDESCTFGVWHPLAAEKLLSLSLNIVPDHAVFAEGYVRVPGYSTLKC